jgi:hypothetical protein
MVLTSACKCSVYSARREDLCGVPSGSLHDGLACKALISDCGQLAYEMLRVVRKEVALDAANSAGEGVGH